MMSELRAVLLGGIFALAIAAAFFAGQWVGQTQIHEAWDARDEWIRNLIRDGCTWRTDMSRVIC